MMRMKWTDTDMTSCEILSRRMKTTKLNAMRMYKDNFSHLHLSPVETRDRDAATLGLSLHDVLEDSLIIISTGPFGNPKPLRLPLH